MDLVFFWLEDETCFHVDRVVCVLSGKCVFFVGKYKMIQTFNEIWVFTTYNVVYHIRYWLKSTLVFFLLWCDAFLAFSVCIFHIMNSYCHTLESISLISIKHVWWYGTMRSVFLLGKNTSPSVHVWYKSSNPIRMKNTAVNWLLPTSETCWYNDQDNCSLAGILCPVQNDV